MSEFKLSVQLQRDLATGHWLVRKVEASRDVVKTVTTFRVPMHLDSVFDAEISAFLEHLLPARIEPMASSMDHKSFANTGITFRGIRVLAQRALAGIQSVTVRIQSVVGAMGDIFLSETAKSTAYLPRS